ncbi:MAG: ATP-binding protein [Gammaproteobacteria bacterium]|nr:ATP-binding protein [Gammaproteobacteria bacterium]
MNLQDRMEHIHAGILARKNLTPTIAPALTREEKEKLQKIEQSLQQVPLMYRGKNFADFNIDYTEQMKVKAIALRYVETFATRLQNGNAILFSGSPGTGKTLLALIIHQALSKAGHYVHYEPGLQFLRTLQEKNMESTTAFSKLSHFYQSMDLLIIDEAAQGRVKGSELLDWEKEMLFTIANVRNQAKLPTLLITNLNKENFYDALSLRIAERFMQQAITLAFNWKSYR